MHGPWWMVWPSLQPKDSEYQVQILLRLYSRTWVSQKRTAWSTAGLISLIQFRGLFVVCSVSVFDHVNENCSQPVLMVCLHSRIPQTRRESGISVCFLMFVLCVTALGSLGWLFCVWLPRVIIVPIEGAACSALLFLVGLCTGVQLPLLLWPLKVQFAS